MTALGERVRVVVGKKGVRLVDLDRNAANARVKVLDINRGNRQVAHGINRVLRPLDLLTRSRCSKRAGGIEVRRRRS